MDVGVMMSSDLPIYIGIVCLSAGVIDRVTQSHAQTNVFNHRPHTLHSCAHCVVTVTEICTNTRARETFSHAFGVHYQVIDSPVVVLVHNNSHTDR